MSGLQGFRGNLCIFPQNSWVGSICILPADRYSVLESGYSCPHAASARRPSQTKPSSGICYRSPCAILGALQPGLSVQPRKRSAGAALVYLSNQAAKAGSNYFKIPFDRQGLADYLNVDRSALSKELGKMRDEGISDHPEKCVYPVRIVS